MKKLTIKTKKIRSIYKKIYEIYYLHSILNKILLEDYDFENREILTISMLNERYLNSLKKEILTMIPL